MKQRSTLFCLLLTLATTAAIQSQPGIDSNGYSDESDKTRVFGTLYDSSGAILNKADIRIFNDVAPANEVRARVRKSGEYLARGLGRLYTERDVEGLRVRARFEKDGYRPVEIVSSVAKNNGIEINPIMWKLDEDPNSMVQWPIVLTGTVTSSGGKKPKKVKGGTIVLTSPSDSTFRMESAIEKNGEFRVLVWQGPPELILEASSGGKSKSLPLRFNGAPRTDVVTQVNQMVQLDP